MPLGKLRRSDRGMGVPETEALLARALVGRLGTVGPDGTPYVIPLNFVYDPERRILFMHCATTGHKLDNLAANSRACFEVDEPGEITALGPYACDIAQPYRSAVCFGTARIVFDGPEREEALHLLVRKYVDLVMPGHQYKPELRTLKATSVIALQVETMTGKERKL